MKPAFRWFIPCAMAVGVVANLSADVLTLTNSKVMKGIVDESGSDKKWVKFIGAQGTVQVSRDRIKDIKSEPRAQGYVHIGDEFRAQKKFTDALDKYRMALKEDPNFAPAFDNIKAVEDTLAGERKAMRKDAISEIDQLENEIRKAIREGDFAKSEELLKTSSGLQPTEDQKTELQKLVGELYVAWAKERLDKFDRAGAEEKLNLALAATPENDDVIEMLLNLWEGQPDKQEQTLQIYETVLARRPDDQTMRRKLADLYYKGNRLEDSAKHYLKLYKDGGKKMKASPLEGLLSENLERLHAQFGQKKDFDKAIYYYQVLQAVQPDADPSVLTYYEYLKRAGKIAKEDVKGRLEIADWCESNGLDQEALTHYRLVQAQDAGNTRAAAAIDRYALALIESAQSSFDKQDYFLAKAVADQVQREFPESKEAQERAKTIIGASNNEIQREAQQGCELAQKYVESGDSYFQQALVFYDRIFNRDYQNSTIRISNPKSDARRYFGYAVDAYQQAMKLCPALKNEAGSLVGPRMKEAQSYLNRINSGPSPSRRNYGRVLDPVESYSSNLPTNNSNPDPN